MDTAADQSGPFQALKPLRSLRKEILGGPQGCSLSPLMSTHSDNHVIYRLNAEEPTKQAFGVKVIFI